MNPTITDFGIIRTSAILTTAYVLSEKILDNVEGNNQLVVSVDFTIGSLTSAEVKLEFSNDNVDWYQETFAAISTGTETNTLGEHTLTATGKYTILSTIKHKFIRISAKGTGIVTGSLMQIKASTGNV